MSKSRSRKRKPFADRGGPFIDVGVQFMGHDILLRAQNDCGCDHPEHWLCHRSNLVGRFNEFIRDLDEVRRMS